MPTVKHASIIKKDQDVHEQRFEIDIGSTPEYADQMPRSQAGLRVTEEEFWQTYYHESDIIYEWNNGILEEKPMADYLSFKMYRWFLKLLEEFLRAFPIAKMIGLEIGFRLALPEKTSIRRPDLAIILHANPVDIEDEECTYRGIFDLCIEFLSDSKPQDVTRDTVVKKLEYCQAGVREYFILDRKGRETAFYRLDRHGKYVPLPQLPNGIIRSDVLTGFQFRVADLYNTPELLELVNDPIYRSYILREYQAERQHADAERQRADAARQRAEAEQQEKLKFAAKLRELGIDPKSL
ncbi:hypothetical protein U27_00112 [Candidatus Vecturithrix granuli]|uniref:Putative restriction endonuclease domain-containing protein n=1 Tax=Vecturithrix granuli TaxID=1499967 RepID=A0A081C6L6_VECG1|nr:hypothetical protein U27_00112 [Candidatus Vecturithrix granuli]